MSHFRPASTAVLTNSDLLDCIFVFVLPPMPQPVATAGVQLRQHGHFAQCATICRAFHEPVIRLLWRDLDTLIPLWQLFAPPDTRCVRYYDKWDQVQLYLLKVSIHTISTLPIIHTVAPQVLEARLFDDPIKWDRFLWHTAHVRDISLLSHNLKPITAIQLRLVEILLMKNSGNSIFPLLHSIRWRRRDPADSSLIPFFTSTLRCAAFTLAGKIDDQAHALLLRRVCDASPYLEKITIDTSAWPDDNLVVGPRVVRELLRFDQLREIEIHEISRQETFLDLVKKPYLTSLTILDIPASWEPPLSPILVHGLCNLSVGGTGSSGLVGLFGLVRFQALQAIKIDVKPSLDAKKEIEAVLKAFFAAAPSDKLQSITLFITGYHFLDSPSSSTSLRDLVHPLFPFREIRSFTFYDDNPKPQIDDIDIQALAAAWPTLERLSLESAFCSETPPISILALYHIRMHCPCLQELRLNQIRLPVLGVHLIPAPPRRLASPPHPLRQLWLACCLWIREPGSDLEDKHAEAFARYLLELFPDLDTESYRWWRDRARSLKAAASQQGYVYGMGVLSHMYTIRSKC